MVSKVDGAIVEMLGSNDPLIRVGDEIEFFKQADLSHRALARVGQVQNLGFSGTSGAFEYRLTLTAAVQVDPGDSAIDASATSEGFIIAGNVIGDNYARGMLIQASNGYIIGNRIQRSSLGGIIMSPEALILEAGWVRNVEVAWNEISGTGIAVPGNIAQAGAIVVSLTPGSNHLFSTPKIWSTACENYNISIHDNIIKNVGTCGVLLTNVDNAEVYSNKIWSNQWNPEPRGTLYANQQSAAFGMTTPYAAIQVERCENISITNNEIDAAPGLSGEDRSLLVPSYGDSRDSTNVTASLNRRVYHTSFERGLGASSDWATVEPYSPHYYNPTGAWTHQDQELLFSFQNWGLYGMDLTAPYFLDRQTSVAQLNQASMEITVAEPDDIQFYFGSSHRNGYVSMSVEARDNLNNLISTSTFVNNATTLDGSSSAPFWTPKSISLPSGATGNWKFTFTRSSSNSAELFVDDIVVGSGLHQNYPPNP